MNTNLRNILLAATLLTTGALAFGACYVSPAPVSGVEVHASTVPSRVYYEGRYLYYRTDGYYFYNRGGWHRARAVPTHVARYHRPSAYRPTAYRPATRPTHVTRGYDRRPTYYRPPASSRPSYRPPAAHRPTHRPTARPPASHRPTARPPASSRPTARPPSRGTVRTPHGARPTTGRSVYRR